MDIDDSTKSWESTEPPIPRPFEPSPRPLVPKSGVGCGKAALVGCGLLLLVFGVAAVVLVSRADDLALWLMGKLRTQVEGSLSEDVTEEEREDLGLAFDSFGEAVVEGRIDPVALQELQSLLLDVAQKSGEGALSRDDVRRLREALERAVLPQGSGAVAARFRAPRGMSVTA